jgi:MraZ protein
MLTRKTQYAWMAMGGLICLFGLALACKLRDGNRAVAQGDKPSVSPSIDTEDKDLPPPPPPAPDTKPRGGFNSVMPFTPDKVLAPKNETKKKAPDKPKDAVEPKAVLGTPSSTEPYPVLPPPSAPKLISGPPAAPLPPLAAGPGLILPASFGPNTPTPKDVKKDEKPKGSPLPAYVPAPQPPIASEKADRTTQAKSAPIPMTGTPLRAWPVSPIASSDGETKVAPTSYAPTAATGPSSLHGPDQEARVQPGEPPLAPAPGPVQLYHVHGPETLQDIARRTLGSGERWTDLHKLNPALKPDTLLSSGTTVRLPGDACVQADEAEPVKPLPSLRPKPAPPKAKVLPLTGTYQCSLDEKGQLTLPRALRDQLAGSDTVLISPGPDRCLWLTNQPHLERLAERLEQSQANEMDVRVFKRLYYAQTEKLPVNGDGRIALPERLAQFAGLHQELVLVGIDDHFEVWDAARWRQYTQQKGAAVTHSTALSDSE